MHPDLFLTRHTDAYRRLLKTIFREEYKSKNTRAQYISWLVNEIDRQLGTSNHVEDNTDEDYDALDCTDDEEGAKSEFFANLIKGTIRLVIQIRKLMSNACSQRNS